jgi:hypothetical protein
MTFNVYRALLEGTSAPHTELFLDDVILFDVSFIKIGSKIRKL